MTEKDKLSAEENADKEECTECKRIYFMKTGRIGFSKWAQDDIGLATLLWGDSEVTRFICVTGIFCEDDIENRLNREIFNEKNHQVQYWPIFEIAFNNLLGCCGLRPSANREYEMGFHLRPEFWGKGYAKEAANAVINYAFTVLKAKKLVAGHNPNNIASQKLLNTLGFAYVHDEFYEPTGLYHPSYELRKIII